MEELREWLDNFWIIWKLLEDIDPSRSTNEVETPETTSSSHGSSRLLCGQRLQEGECLSHKGSLVSCCTSVFRTQTFQRSADNSPE